MVDFNEETTPLPWRFKDVRKVMGLQGWSYNDRASRFELKEDGETWIARLRETDYGVNIDIHVLKNGKEMMAL